MEKEILGEQKLEIVSFLPSNTHTYSHTHRYIHTHKHIHTHNSPPSNSRVLDTFCVKTYLYYVLLFLIQNYAIYYFKT